MPRLGSSGSYFGHFQRAHFQPLKRLQSTPGCSGLSKAMDLAFRAMFATSYRMLSHVLVNSSYVVLLPFTIVHPNPFGSSMDHGSSLCLTPRWNIFKQRHLPPCHS